MKRARAFDPDQDRIDEMRELTEIAISSHRGQFETAASIPTIRRREQRARKRVKR
jgi:hypothetical protein